MRQYKFIRDVQQAEWSALPRSFLSGEVVHRGSDPWGLCRDDARLGCVETLPCTEDGRFVFTVPADMLVSVDGNRAMGDYWVE